MLFDAFKSLSRHLVAFRQDEDGAVTVDFVVLTSSVVLMGVAHAVDVANGTTNIAEAVETCLIQDIGAIVTADNSTPEAYLANLAAAEAGCSSR